MATLETYQAVTLYAKKISKILVVAAMLSMGSANATFFSHHYKPSYHGGGHHVQKPQTCYKYKKILFWYIKCSYPCNGNGNGPGVAE